ncbi:MAG: hypothetical protein HYV96_11040 [Opitutae bacterium]|nr:hypothetical protein [Opitutae bacterium]
MSDSYLEKCIQALPPEKRPAAREALHSISENGNDSIFAKVLVAFEATSAYADTIPQAIVVSGEKLLREFDTRLERLAAQTSAKSDQRDEMLREFLRQQIPALGKALALDKVEAGLIAQTAELGRFERSLARLRQARVGGLALLMALGFLLGCGAVTGIFWSSYREAQQAQEFVDQLNATGIGASIKRTDQGELLSITGPHVLRGTAWRKDAQGYIVGADFLFPSESSR